MPHIRAIFIDTPEVREFLKAQKTVIRKTIAHVLGYPYEDVALYPHRISQEDSELADNLLPLEFVVDSGTGSLEMEENCAKQIKMDLLDWCDGADRIHFGLWLVSHGKNAFVEHKPKAK